MNEDHIKQYGLRVAEKVRDEVCKAAGSAVGVEWMWVDGDLQAIVASVAVPHEKNTQQPVAWCELNSNGGIAYFDGKPMFMPGAFGNECHPVPLFTAKPVPRDVLMAVAEEVREQTLETAWQIGKGKLRSAVDLAAIADRYASKVQPEPANQQLLAALKDIASDYADRFDLSSSSTNPGIKIVIEQARAAIAAAEAAQTVCQTCKGSGYIGDFLTLAHDCPDCQHPASAAPVAVPDESCPHCCGSGVMPKAAIAPPPPDVPCRNCNGTGKVRAILAAAQKQEGGE